MVSIETERSDVSNRSKPGKGRGRFFAIAAVLVGVGLGLSFGQSRNRGGFRGWDRDAGPITRTEGGVPVNEDTVQTARETAPHSMEFPVWTNEAGFERDVFTFTRIIFKSDPPRGWLGWVNDYPDGDLNLSFRLQQLTSVRADPDGRVLKLTNPALNEYPFIFMSHPEAMALNEEEAKALRNYLLNGGALMTDDFWGDHDWKGFESQMKLVLPGRHWEDLPKSHRVFYSVYDLRAGPMNKLQVPSIHRWRRAYNPSQPWTSSSGWRGPGSEEMHVRAWLDDQQRVMIIAGHNTDLGDGWEREGENEEYFHEFSETRAYPLAINIIFYLMTN